MIDSWLSGVHTATQGSGSLARTTPPEKAARNRAGMLSRFFASSECSKWPRNANWLSDVPHCGPLWGEEFGPEWRSGRNAATPVLADWGPPYPTFSHFATQHPTSFRPMPLPAPAPMAISRSRSGIARGYHEHRRARPGRARRPESGRWMGSCLQPRRMQASLHDERLDGHEAPGVHQGGEEGGRHQQQHRGHQQEGHDELDLRSGLRGLLPHPALQGKAGVPGLG
jgi:hypothetical protein